jgi:hypothetical protein
MAKSLLEQIEQEALDSSSSLADALRKCVALGGQSGSTELRRWATQELRGYSPDADVPEYREISAPIAVDGFTGSAMVKGQQVHSSDWPDFVQEHVTETLTLYNPIAELEAMAQSGEVTQLGIPQAGLLKQMYETQGQSVVSIYWQVSPIPVRGVIDQVRTALVELVAQLREGAENPEEPTAEEANNAVQVVVHGQGHRVNVTTAQTGGGRTTIAAPSEPKRPWWRTGPGLWTIGGVIVAAVGVFITWLALD